MPKAQETVLEIDLNALKHNFEYLKSKLQDGTKFLAVVKAFAYGSDACEIAKHLQNLNIDYFAVAYVNEGIALRNAGITKPILVLHPQTVNFEAIITHCLEPNLYNAKILKAFIDLASKEKLKEYPVHIKFNTGLNRLGFCENNVHDIVLTQMVNMYLFKLVLFTHLVFLLCKQLELILDVVALPKDWTQRDVNILGLIKLLDLILLQKDQVFLMEDFPEQLCFTMLTHGVLV